LISNPQTHCRIISLYKKLKNKQNKETFLKDEKYFIDVCGPLYVCKMVEIHHKKNL